VWAAWMESAARAKRGLEPEAVVDVGDVVVDGLGHPHHRQGHALGGRGVRDGLRPPQRAVSPDHEEHRDPEPGQRGDDLALVLAAP